VCLDPERLRKQSHQVVLQLAQRLILAPGILQHHGKTTGPEVGEAVSAETGLEPIRDPLQQVIAGVASVRVVDDAQVLDIDDRHRRLCLFDLPTGQTRREALTEQHTLGKSGQRIEVRQKLHRAFLLEVLQRE